MDERIESILEKMAIEWIREQSRGPLLEGLIADISLMTSTEEKRKKDLDEELAEWGLF